MSSCQAFELVSTCASSLEEKTLQNETTRIVSAKYVSTCREFYKLGTVKFFIWSENESIINSTFPCINLYSINETEGLNFELYSNQ